MTTYRGNGAWGSGVGRRLLVSEVDTNFYGHDTRLTSLETNPPTAVGISNIVVSGTQMTIYLSNGTSFGPFTLPTAVFRVRGDWAANTVYAAMDLVYVASSGLYLVLQDHTSGATFDPDLSSSTGDVYQQVLPVLTPAAIKTVGATSYEPGPTDAGKYIRCTSSTGCVIELTSAFATGDELHFRQAGSGAISFIGGDTGGQINSVAGKDDSTDHVGAVVTCKHLGNGEWDIFGDLAAATA